MGTFKVNVREPEDEATGQAPEKEEKDEKEEEKKEKEETKKKITARMIMRADGVLRVMLNSPIFKGMPVGDVSGAEPKGKQLNLASVEEGRTVPLLLRVRFDALSNLSSFGGANDDGTGWKSRIGQGAIWGDQGDSRASVINRSTLETVVLSVVDRIILLQ